MSDRAQLVGLLRIASAAMPTDERARFRRYLRGLERPGEADLVPGTPFLPPITVNRPAKPPRPQAGTLLPPNERPSWALKGAECGWYYGERCGCGDPANHGHAYVQPRQLPLPFGPGR